MAKARFSGNSSYELEAVAGRQGRDIYVDVYVNRVGSYKAWSSAQQPWSVTIDGQKQSFTWTYDFRNSTRKLLGRVWRRGLAVGNRGWSSTVQMASGIGTATVNGTVNIPPDAPRAPTFGSTRRDADNRIFVSWTRNASSTAPYDSIQVQRQEHSAPDGWSNWRTVSTISGSSSSFTDTSTTANRLYRYRVVAVNSAGSGASGVSKYTFTTPAAPGVELVKMSGGQVQARITPKTPGHTEYVIELQQRVGDGAWEALTTLDAGENTYTWSPDEGGTVQAQARAVIDSPGDPGNGLASSWQASNVVPLQAPPKAPSDLKPNGQTVDARKDVVLSWTYTSGDTSDQTAREIQRSTDGGETWEDFGGRVETSEKTATFAPTRFAKGTTYQWRVRVWGVHADPSPWSQPATVKTEDPPTVNITSPAGEVTTSTITVEWEPVPGQSAWRVELRRDGQTVESKNGSGTTSAYTFSTRATNGTSYTVRVQVRDGSGLWSDWAETTFTAEFPTPAPPAFTLEWDDERGAVLVAIDNPDGTPRNLATRPSFEAAGDRATLMENFHQNPIPSSDSGFAAVGSGASIAYETSTVKVTTGTGTDTGAQLAMWTPSGSGARMTASVDVWAESAVKLRFTATGAVGAASADIALAAGERRRISHTFTATGTTEGAVRLVRAASGDAVNFTVQNILFDKSREVRDYFDGSTVTAETNLAPNPLAPDESQTGGWRGSPDDQITYPSVDGQFVVELEEAGGTGSFYLDPAKNITGLVGETIRFFCEVWTDDQVMADGMQLRVLGYDGGDVRSSSVAHSIQAGVWTPVMVETRITAAPSGAYFRALVWPSHVGGIGARIRVRRAVMQVGRFLGGQWFFTGTRPGTFETAWTGDAGASTSILTATRTAGLSTSSSALSYRSTVGRVVGDYAAMHHQTLEAATPQAFPVPGMRQGVPHRVQLRLHPVASGRVIIYMRPTLNSTSGQVVVADIEMVAGEPVTVDQVVTSPAGTGSNSGLAIVPQTRALGDRFATDAVIVTDGETRIPYFDGDSPGATWEGERHASASVRAATAANNVYRSYDQVTWVEVASNVPPDGTISDAEVILNRDIWYRVEAISPAGTTAQSEPQMIRTTTQSGFWSVGPGFSTSLRVAVHINQSPSLDLTTSAAYKETHYFAGRVLPVEFTGSARRREGAASFAVLSIDERDQAVEMSYMAAPHLIRLPDGVFMYTSIGAVDTSRHSEGVYVVEFPVLEVER